MAVPKKRTGHSAQGKRRSNWKATKPTLTKCPNCGQAVLAHTVCTACGTYKGKTVSKKGVAEVVEEVKEVKTEEVKEAKKPRKSTKKAKAEAPAAEETKAEEVKEAEVVEEKKEEATEDKAE